MISWHGKSCIRPDVRLVDANPFCMSCGSLASTDDLDGGQIPPPPTIPAQRRSHLNLTWPSSVNYAASCLGAGSDGTDLGGLVMDVVTGTRYADRDTMELDSETLSDGTLSGDEDVTLTTEESELDASQTRSPGPAIRRYTNSQRNSVPLDEELTGTDTIRILCLSKGKGSEPLHGVLHVHQLKYFPEYEALSYTWADANGDTTRTKKLYLGHGWDILPIARNCEAALRALRLPNKDRYLWVDAVCINHSKVRERSNQVLLMPVIYATAQRVLVYLGNDKQTMDIKATRLRTGRYGWDEKWNMVDENLKRPYFFRSWIIQEIANAKTALVTDGKTWRVWPIHSNLAQTQTFLPWIRHFDTRKYKTSDDLVQLVVDSWSSQATDPRDKVFALLGLISGASADGLTADYTLSPEQVYTGFASFALQRLKATSLLRYSSGYEKPPGLPSWVPDWRQLSNDWAIMVRLEQFDSKVVMRNLLRTCKISPEMTERLSHPWTTTAPSSEIVVYAQTGALCLYGIQITDLSQPNTVEPVMDTFCVFELDSLFVAAPITARKGDSVFFLQGFSCPVVLRRVVNSSVDLFSFVGMCHARIQTGLTMREDVSSLLAIHERHHDILQRRSLAIHAPERWCERVAPFVGYRGETYELLIELCDLEPAQYSVSQWALFEELGREIEREWTRVLTDNLRMLLMVPLSQSSDIMHPVPGLLEELVASIQQLSALWGEVSGYLQECRQWDSQIPSNRRYHILSRRTQLDKQSERLLELNLDADWMGRLVVDEEARDELRARYSTHSGNPISASFDPLVSNDRDPEAYCPTWHQLQRDGKSFWYKMTRLHAIYAADHLRVAVPDEISDLRVFPTYVSPSITLDESIDEASRWREMFDTAAKEVQLAKRAVEALMKQRCHYQALMGGTWRRIAIL